MTFIRIQHEKCFLLQLIAYCVICEKNEKYFYNKVRRCKGKTIFFLIFYFLEPFPNIDADEKEMTVLE